MSGELKNNETFSFFPCVFNFLTYFRMPTVKFTVCGTSARGFLISFTCQVQQASPKK